MNTISYTSAHKNLAGTMKKVCENHSPVVITHKNQQSVVIISLEDYQSMEETAYLLRSPANAQQLFESINELESGNTLTPRS